MHLRQMHSVGPHIHANIGTAANSPLGRAINGTAAHTLLTAANREPLRYGVRDSRKELTSADSFFSTIRSSAGLPSNWMHACMDGLAGSIFDDSAH
jgi:hypothetical protein